MAVGTYALTTLAKLKAYLNLTIVTHDTLLEDFVDRVTALIEDYTNRNLKARDYSYVSTSGDYDADNAILDGNNRDSMVMPQYPVNTLTTLRINTMAIDARPDVFATGYVIEKELGIIRLAGYLYTRGLRNIECVYNAGYSTIPEDLEQACIEQAAWMFKQSPVGSSLLGVASKTLPDGSISYTSGELLAQVKRVLEKHRKRIAL